MTSIAAFEHAFASMPSPYRERFVNRIRIEPQSLGIGSCWMWTRNKATKRYGQFEMNRRLFPGITRHAHRIAYLFAKGPAPRCLEIDHLCKNKRCVNPAHLEAVTKRENIERGDFWKYNSAKTHCPSGHPYSGENLRVNSFGRRECRECHRRHNRNNKAKVRARKRLLREIMEEM